MKKIIGRILIVIIPVMLQIAWYVMLFGVIDRGLNGYLGDILTIVFTVLAVLFVLSLITRREESSYKLLWVLTIVALPILGAMLYLMLGNKKTGTRLKRRLNKASGELLEKSFLEEGKRVQTETDEIIQKIDKDDLRLGQTLKQLAESTGFPIVPNDTSKYYPLGEDMYKDMLEDLKEAKKYVFVEYFIIQSGKFWDSIVDILELKAGEGVDVRVMYDDLGSIGTYSVKDIRSLRSKGIKCMAFNPFFLITSQLNNRDHRKIMVIDGQVAYSGGVNLADEYINEIEKFGQWKDIGFRLTGPAVRSYTFMFAEFWNAFTVEKIPDELLLRSSYKNETCDNGYVLPFYDSPMRAEPSSNVLFTEVLSMATDYVWFYTPYLMLGDALFDAFLRAARRGVDVRIVMPGIPDKKMVYRLGRSYYRDLIKAGVKIYEYTPGFVHAKAFIADDKLCGIGTVNLDYRSLFLHFECSSIFYKADIISEIKKDYQNSLSKSRQRTLEDTKRNIFGMLLDSVLRVIAPLL